MRAKTTRKCYLSEMYEHNGTTLLALHIEIIARDKGCDGTANLL